MSRINEIKEREAKAVKTPWQTHDGQTFFEAWDDGALLVSRLLSEDVPWLIARIEKLEEIVKEEAQWHYEEDAAGRSRSSCHSCGAILGKTKHAEDCKRFTTEGEVK